MTSYQRRRNELNIKRAEQHMNAECARRVWVGGPGVSSLKNAISSGLGSQPTPFFKKKLNSATLATFT